MHPLEILLKLGLFAKQGSDEHLFLQRRLCRAVFALIHNRKAPSWEETRGGTFFRYSYKAKPVSAERRASVSVSKNPFRHADRLQKSSEDKQLTPVGVHRYGNVCERRLRRMQRAKRSGSGQNLKPPSVRRTNFGHRNREGVSCAVSQNSCEASFFSGYKVQNTLFLQIKTQRTKIHKNGSRF